MSAFLPVKLVCACERTETIELPLAFIPGSFHSGAAVNILLPPARLGGWKICQPRLWTLPAETTCPDCSSKAADEEGPGES